MTINVEQFKLNKLFKLVSFLKSLAMKASVSTLFILLNFACFLQLSFEAGQSQNLYVKSVFCNASEKFVHKNFTCFAKSYSRTVSTVTIIFPYKKPHSDSVVIFFQ